MRLLLVVLCLSMLASCQYRGSVRTILTPDTEWDCKGSTTHKRVKMDCGTPFEL